MNYGVVMMNKSKVIKIVLSVLAVVIVICAVIFVTDSNKRFEMTEKSIIAMDTVVTEKIYAEEDSATYIRAVGEIINGLEDKISRYEQDSAVSALNRGEKVSDTSLRAVIDTLEEISRETDGAFDITVGKLVDLWGIGEGNEEVPDSKAIKNALESVDYTALKEEDNLFVLEGEAELDLGAIGKGYACDLIKAYFTSTDVKGAVVSVGGSILAYGDYNKKGDKWNVAVRHPRSDNEYLGIISLDEGFVSTSGDYERYFEKDGVRYHHIFDANTGYPASSGLISVTVVAESGILSDALSTACFILGKEKGTELLEKYNSSAVFVDEDMNITTVGDIEFESQ